MTKWLAILGALLSLLVAASLATAGDVATISPDELLVELKSKQEKVVVLDVRSQQEYDSGHVPGALHIPYDELAGRVDEVKAQEADKVVVYCEAGGRAGKAEATLQEAGFENVYDLEGHMRAWRADKRPTKRPLSTQPSATQPSAAEPSAEPAPGD